MALIITKYIWFLTISFAAPLFTALLLSNILYFGVRGRKFVVSEWCSQLVDLDFIADCDILHRSLTTKSCLLYLFG